MKSKLIALFMIVAMLCGCSSNGSIDSDSSENYTPEPGGTIKLACFVPDTLNPLATKYQNVRDVMMVVYEGLFKAEDTLIAIPVLATGYTVSTSNKIYSITLKNNITFHDGSEFDADDVIATFNYIKEYDTPYSPIFENVLNYEKTDKYSVSVELISPQADFVNNLDFPILTSGLSEHSFSQEDTAFIPNGTGRYKYSSRVHNKNLTLVRNNDWHGNKPSYPDKVFVSFMHNSTDLFHAFDAGEIDIFTTNGSNWGEFNFTTNNKCFETGSPRYTYIGINTERDKLKDVTLRQDINNLIDRKEMVETVMFSHAVPAKLPIISTSYYFDYKSPTGEKPSEEQKAPEILKYDISLGLLYNNESKLKERAANYLKKEFETYGITLNLNPVDFDDYKECIEEGEYDLYLGEVIMNNNMNMDFMFSSVQHTSQNLCTFLNSEFDAMLANHNMMSPDKENHELTFYNFEKYFMENIPQIPLFHSNSALFVNSRIKGEIKANMSSFYGDIGDLFINYKEK